MKTFTLVMASAAALALMGGAAYAQAPDRSDRGGAMTRAQVEQRTVAAFERMDANKDGVFDTADREARKTQRSEWRAKRHEARFAQLDADSDGAISKAEFDAPRERGAKGGQHAGKRFGHRAHRMGGFGGRGMFKAGGGQSMTQAQVTAAALERFDRTDANKDGTVTADERREAFKAFREQRQAARAAEQS
ncbi:MAG TPA: hypothetical protein VL100_10535 [Croceibacterium sp.]|nr:hypothetical protein [Croceibacterium sp.]